MKGRAGVIAVPVLLALILLWRAVPRDAPIRVALAVLLLGLSCVLGLYAMRALHRRLQVLLYLVAREEREKRAREAAGIYTMDDLRRMRGRS